MEELELTESEYNSLRRKLNTIFNMGHHNEYYTSFEGWTNDRLIEATNEEIACLASNIVTDAMDHVGLQPDPHLAWNALPDQVWLDAIDRIVHKPDN